MDMTKFEEVKDELLQDNKPFIPNNENEAMRKNRRALRPGERGFLYQNWKTPNNYPAPPSMLT
jgi:hypothetical protein